MFFFVLGNPPTPSPTHNVFLSFCWWFLVKYCVTSNTNSPGITISWWPRLQLIRFCLKRIRDQNEFEELLLKMSNTNNLVYYSIYTIDGEPHIYSGTVTWSSISTYLHLFIYLLGCCVDIYKSIDPATNVLLYGKKASLVVGRPVLLPDNDCRISRKLSLQANTCHFTRMIFFQGEKGPGSH